MCQKSAKKVSWEIFSNTWQPIPPFQLSVATPKPGLSEAASLVDDAYSDPSYSGYYEHYWADQAAWGNYGSYQVGLGTRGEPDVGSEPELQGCEGEGGDDAFFFFKSPGKEMLL